jgi:hypothetical protein
MSIKRFKDLKIGEAFITDHDNRANVVTDYVKTSEAGCGYSRGDGGDELELHPKECFSMKPNDIVHPPIAERPRNND